MLGGKWCVVSFNKMMFCPLCKAEYRQGFTTCADCHIALVATEQEALNTKVEQLWAGDDPQLSSALLDSLEDAEIPFRSREVLRRNIWPWLSIFLWRFVTPKPVPEYRVYIFEKDADRARSILQKFTLAEPV
jgi:hypothetical protein